MNAWIRCGAAAVSLAVLSLACALAEGAGAAAGNTNIYYFQLIHGSDSEIPPTKEAKRIGPKLVRKLQDVFRWKNYWEVRQGEFKIEEHKTAKVSVSDRRYLELSFVGNDGLEVRMFKEGKLVRKTREKRSMKFMLLGGDDGKRQSWFVVLRRDKPSNAELRVRPG